jgi:hypothetical protein
MNQEPQRCITESWWRKIKIFEVFHASSRWDSRSHVITLVINRKMNRRHMISDHHGRVPTSQPGCSQPRTGFSARTKQIQLNVARNDRKSPLRRAGA